MIFDFRFSIFDLPSAICHLPSAICHLPSARPQRTAPSKISHPKSGTIRAAVTSAERFVCSSPSGDPVWRSDRVALFFDHDRLHIFLPSIFFQSMSWQKNGGQKNGAWKMNRVLIGGCEDGTVSRHRLF
ncbi:MAG: hypothetical protein ACKV2Q_21100 [Planctomycetaceae bacterium]